MLAALARNRFITVPGPRRVMANYTSLPALVLMLTGRLFAICGHDGFSRRVSAKEETVYLILEMVLKLRFLYGYYGINLDETLKLSSPF